VSAVGFDDVEISEGPGLAERSYRNGQLLDPALESTSFSSGFYIAQEVDTLGSTAPSASSSSSNWPA
jgi:hypothetical protein